MADKEPEIKSMLSFLYCVCDNVDGWQEDFVNDPDSVINKFKPDSAGSEWEEMYDAGMTVDDETAASKVKRFVEGYLYESIRENFYETLTPYAEKKTGETKIPTQLRQTMLSFLYHIYYDDELRAKFSSSDGALVNAVMESFGLDEQVRDRVNAVRGDHENKELLDEAIKEHITKEILAAHASFW